MKGQKKKKEKVSISLPPEVIERARIAVYYTPGMSLASLFEDALWRELKRLERKQGKPFPEPDSKDGSKAELAPGRPVKRVKTKKGP